MTSEPVRDLGLPAREEHGRTTLFRIQQKNKCSLCGELGVQLSEMKNWEPVRKVT